MSCEVCAEKFNKSDRKPVKCAHAECAYEACTSCHKRYILDKCYQKPHCMSCKKVWTPEFKANFTKVFWDRDYRKARENVLFEEEKTYLPAYQAQADRLLRIAKSKAAVEDLRQKIHINDANEDQLVRDQRRIHRELSEKYETALKELRSASRPLEAQKEQEKKVFRVKCPVKDCRGYLCDKYVCGLCHVTICKDCNEVKEEVNAAEKVEHKCDEGNVATMIEIRKTSKPCPTCGMAIFKIDGCDQMFCTVLGCQTGFSWRTGEIDLGVMHNPEYFKLLREGKIQNPRHRQHQGACDQMPMFYDIQGKLLRAPISAEQEERFGYYYQRFTHHRQVTLRRFRDQTAREADRLKYLTGEMDEETFKQKVYVANLADERKNEERQIIETFVSIGEELFRQLEYHNAIETLKQMENVTDITYKAIVDLDTKHKYVGCVKPREIKIV